MSSSGDTAGGRGPYRETERSGGNVALVEADPVECKEKGRFSQPERSGAQAWPHPVVAGGRLYLRDWDKLFVYDLKAE